MSESSIIQQVFSILAEKGEITKQDVRNLELGLTPEFMARKQFETKNITDEVLKTAAKKGELTDKEIETLKMGLHPDGDHSCRFKNPYIRGKVVVKLREAWLSNKCVLTGDCLESVCISQDCDNPFPRKEVLYRLQAAKLADEHTACQMEDMINKRNKFELSDINEELRAVRQEYDRRKQFGKLSDEAEKKYEHKIKHLKAKQKLCL